jgi:hypothetical protein
MRMGATALCKWVGEDDPIEYYFSFGEYDEETGQDTFGVNDDRIFFYCSEGDLLKMVGRESQEWEVVRIIEYAEGGSE